VIRSISGRRFFALSTEQLIPERSVLTAKILDLGFELLGPMHGPRVLSFPIPNLLPHFVVLTPQFGNFLAQLKNFVTKLPHQLEEISRRTRRKWFNDRVFHDTAVWNPDLPCLKRPTIPMQTGWAKPHLQALPNPERGRVLRLRACFGLRNHRGASCGWRGVASEEAALRITTRRDAWRRGSLSARLDRSAATTSSGDC
jgi:hypothetical protein